MTEDQIKELETAVIFLRGMVLSQTVEVERKMDEFLSLYFCATKQKKDEICELLFFTERITFDIKKQILYAILDSHFKSFLKNNPEFVKSIEEMIPHRNIFAHLEVNKEESIVDGSPEDMVVVFKRYKGGKNKPVYYSLKKVEEIAESMATVNVHLKHLIAAMPPLA